MIPLLVYLITVNAVSFALMLADKWKAKKRSRRIPEKTLLSFAVIGGSVGVLAGMYLVRHKTLHLKFTLGVPAILAAQVVVAIILWG